jgi:hypothetical protein
MYRKTTGKRLIVENFTFLITTFPRCPYNVSQGLMFFNVIPISFHPDVVINFMHEVLHFQTHYYWERNPRSLMSKLSKEEFYFAKESLTVILDNELKPLIKKSDKVTRRIKNFVNCYTNIGYTIITSIS